MFTPDVIEKLQYYVYRLVDPRDGKTFYIGKGKGNRVFEHVNDELKHFEKDEDEISAKMQQIRDIRKARLEVIHIIQRHGLTEKEAFEVEAALIDCYAGLTNLVAGHSSDRGVNNAEVLQRELSLEEFEDVDDLNYCIIKINDYFLHERGSVYETVRRSWKVNHNRISKIEYVIAAHNGVALDVFKVSRWYESSDCSGRYSFEGEEASEDIRKLFVNKRLPRHYMKKGLVSPILYHD